MLPAPRTREASLRISKKPRGTWPGRSNVWRPMKNKDKDSNKRVRRCACCKVPIGVERDDDGVVILRRCVMTGQELTRDKTYLSTRGSTDPVPFDPGPAVQRGAPLND